MLHIYRKKIVVLTLLCLFSIQGIAQNNRILHQTDYDEESVHFGYFLGISMNNYRIRHGSNWSSPSNPYASLVSPMDYGLKMGGLMNRYLTEKIDVRIMPSVAIYSKKLTIYNAVPPTDSVLSEDKDRYSSKDKAWLELPVIFKYKSLRRGNVRMNMFAGMKMAIETNPVNLANKTKRLSSPSRLMDFSIEYGAGLEIFQSYFKLAPEIHISHGIRNLDRNGPMSSPVAPIDFIDRINSHAITFFIFFE